MNSNMLLLIVLIVNIRVVSNFLTGQFRSNFPWLRMHSRPPKLDYAEDLYSVLEVQPNASAVELKKAYYKMVFKYHPDNKEGRDTKELCNQQMMVINAAYKTLRDSLLRARYNLTRHVAKQQPTSPPPNKVSDSVVKENENQRVEPLFRMKENENEPVEPLLDIFADLVRDLALHRGENIFEDLIEFLDGKAGNHSSSTGEKKEDILNTSPPPESMHRQGEERLKDIRILLNIEKSLHEVYTSEFITLNDATLQHQRLECKSRIKQLQKAAEMIVENELSVLSKPFDEGQGCTGRVGYNYDQQKSRRNEIVERELKALKNKMRT